MRDAEVVKERRWRRRRSLPSALSLISATVFLALTGSAQATGTTVYVSASGSDSNNCTSLAQACATFTQALDDVSNGGTIYVSGTIDEDDIAIETQLPITIQGLGSGATINAGQAGYVFLVGQYRTVTFDNLTIENGVNSQAGAGIENNGTTTVEDSIIKGNDSSGSGGGISSYPDGVSIVDSTVSGNSASSYGGGVFVEGGPSSITDSTISGNSASDGGGVYAYAPSATLDISNSTIADNSASGGYAALDNADTITSVWHTTFAGNGNYQIINYDGGTLTTAADVFDGLSTGYSCYQGPWDDLGYNVGIDDTCLDGSPAATDRDTMTTSEVGSLGANGGLSETALLSSGNPALGLIPSGTDVTIGGGTVALCPTTDQRGITSLSGSACDAGATQSQGTAPLTVTSTAPTTAAAGGTYTVTAWGSSPAGASVTIDPSTSGYGTSHVACTVSGSTITFAKVGTCVIDITEAASPPFAATEVKQTVMIGSNPTITAALSSARAKSSYGWYGTPVTISFTCSLGSGPLTAACPSPVTLSNGGANQSVSETINATDGGTASTTLSALNIDTGSPSVEITGVKKNHRYRRAPKARCTASDSISGLAGGCKLTKKSKRTHRWNRITLTATAANEAGNAQTAKLTYYVRRR